MPDQLRSDFDGCYGHDHADTPNIDALDKRDDDRDKAFPYMTMTPDHPGHQRGWQRTYPVNPWTEKVPTGLT